MIEEVLKPEWLSIWAVALAATGLAMLAAFSVWRWRQSRRFTREIRFITYRIFGGPDDHEGRLDCGRKTVRVYRDGRVVADHPGIEIVEEPDSLSLKDIIPGPALVDVSVPTEREVPFICGTTSNSIPAPWWPATSAAHMGTTSNAARANVYGGSMTLETSDGRTVHGSTDGIVLDRPTSIVGVKIHLDAIAVDCSPADVMLSNVTVKELSGSEARKTPEQIEFSYGGKSYRVTGPSDKSMAVKTTTSELCFVPRPADRRIPPVKISLALLVAMATPLTPPVARADVCAPGDVLANTSVWRSTWPATDTQCAFGLGGERYLVTPPSGWRALPHPHVTDQPPALRFERPGNGQYYLTITYATLVAKASHRRVRLGASATEALLANVKVHDVSDVVVALQPTQDVFSLGGKRYMVAPPSGWRADAITYSSCVIFEPTVYDGRHAPVSYAALAVKAVKAGTDTDQCRDSS